VGNLELQISGVFHHDWHQLLLFWTALTTSLSSTDPKSVQTRFHLVTQSAALPTNYTTGVVLVSCQVLLIDLSPSSFSRLTELVAFFTPFGRRLPLPTVDTSIGMPLISVDLVNIFVAGLPEGLGLSSFSLLVKLLCDRFSSTRQASKRLMCRLWKHINSGATVNIIY